MTPFLKAALIAACCLPATAFALSDEYSQAGQNLGLARTCLTYEGDMSLYPHFEQKMIERSAYEFDNGYADAANPKEVKEHLEILRPSVPDSLPDEVPEYVANWCSDLRKKAGR
ncbi:hypothetical protein [Thalassobius sp. Cn5-15]|uniref:hypothetical protein n=1 Tax=Thalassobius sp. Cn5-15 TaxID=2917763 RepID=UPI001EF3C29E|nr:hypothetical protein [Thalassobius sp. Cn5-15]MCG7494608.1 hypothetical protein [Thalassobius sp. Cn5-15]